MNLEEHYRKLEGARFEFLERAHRSAVLTIPSVQPREGQRRHQLPQNFQEVGSRGVNNLTSKLMLTLFPPTLPHMRLEISPADMEDLKAEDAALEADGGEARVVSEVQASLANMERQQQSEFDTEGWRPVVSEAMRLLIVTGNALLYDRPGSKGPVVADLRRFVVERDPENKLQTAILRQGIAIKDAEAVLGEALSDAQKMASSNNINAASTGEEDYLDLFTGARRLESGKFEFFQEIAGLPVGEPQQYDEVDLPLMPLQFQPVYGSSYGRGYVEEYDGGLLVLEQISRSLAEAAMVMSKVIFLVRPGSSSKPGVLNKARNGDIKVGDKEDIGSMQAEKAQDLSVAYQQQRDLTMSLGKAFLLNSSVQRSGERVTGEEIRYVAQELEDALGGVYASLADTVQRPIVFYLFNRMKRSGAIRGVPASVKPIVSTGLEAISRNHKALRITQFLGALNQTVPPEQLVDYIRVDAVAADIATALNLDKDQYIRTPAEIKEIQDKRNEQAQMQAMGPEVLKAASQSQEA